MSTNGEFTGNDGSPGRITGSTHPSDLVEQIVDMSKNLSGVLGHEARAMAGRVTEQLSEKATASVGKGADTLGNLARAMQIAGRQIEPDTPRLARSLDEVARHVDSFANTIKYRNVTELVTGAAELAKRNPTLFLAGAIAAGFAVSRFLRSTTSAQAEDDNRGEE